ncbi:MAG: CPBP family glutamic-type intramembrane protease [Deferrisomatales bacterium]|nr:CPBP family glutamic-type intramembrane protease [Deferrisomatales bacterium]
MSDSTANASDRILIPNRRLLVPYAAPYFAYVALGSLLGDHLAVEWVYGLRLALVPALLWWGRRWYPPVTGPRNPWGSAAVGAATGLVAIGAWITLLTPFASNDVAAWDPTTFILRLLAAGFVVPVFEELFARGYVLRLAYQWDALRREGEHQALAAALDEHTVSDVAPGAWSGWAVAISTLVFAAGHNPSEWPAAVVYGLFMAWLWITRRDLLSCIVAHAVSNLALGGYVLATGAWGLW